MAEDEVIHFFKRNVNHSVSVRFFRGDRDGRVLNFVDNIVEVKDKDLKVFKEVNKNAILQGLIVEVSEPEENWETANAITDDDIKEMLGNYLKLKNGVEKITSVPILYKILEAATERGSSKKTISIIQAQIDAVEPDPEELVTRDEMVRSYDEGLVVTSND